MTETKEEYAFYYMSPADVADYAKSQSIPSTNDAQAIELIETLASIPLLHSQAADTTLGSTILQLTKYIEANDSHKVNVYEHGIQGLVTILKKLNRVLPRYSGWQLTLSKSVLAVLRSEAVIDAVSNKPAGKVTIEAMERVVTELVEDGLKKTHEAEHNIATAKQASESVQYKSKCNFCGTKSVHDLPSCASCGVMKYCDKTCQTKHWLLSHKKACTRTSAVVAPVPPTVFTPRTVTIKGRTYTIRQAVPEDADQLTVMVNWAYRGKPYGPDVPTPPKKSGWTGEQQLVGGTRIDTATLLTNIQNQNMSKNIILVATVDPAEHEVDPNDLFTRLSGDRGLVGSVNVEQLDADGEVGIELGMFAVDPQFQGKGIGGTLFRTGEEVGKQFMNAAMGVMYVVAVRDDLIAVYQSYGYVDTGKTAPFPTTVEVTGAPKGDLYFRIFHKKL